MSDERNAREFELVLVVHGQESAAHEQRGSSISGEDSWEFLSPKEEGHHLGQERSEVEADVHEHRTDVLLRLSRGPVEHKAGHESQTKEPVERVFPVRKRRSLLRLEDPEEPLLGVGGECGREGVHDWSQDEAEGDHEDGHHGEVERERTFAHTEDGVAVGAVEGVDGGGSDGQEVAGENVVAYPQTRGLTIRRKGPPSQQQR